MSDYPARIKKAAETVYPLACKSPLHRAEKLSRELKANIWLKREDQQKVFSFKIRGAANRMAGLTEAEKAKGVVAASAGNHAQGMAVSATHYGIKSTIFMPVTTPPIKVEAVQNFGGETRLVGDSYDEACDAALAFAAETGATFIHPFNEPEVIAGQGTVGMEILDQMDEPPAAIFVPVGGGGLIAGVGAWVKSVSPQTRIIAVEPEGAGTLAHSLNAGKPTPLNSVDGFADGVAVKVIGSETFEIAKDVVDDVVLVSTDEICAAVKDVFEEARTMVEPAGALSLAGLKKCARQNRLPKGPCVAILSGANVNFDRVGYVVERSEFGFGEEMLFAATLPERPGSFSLFCEHLGERAVTEFNYRMSDEDSAHVLVGLKLKDEAGDRAEVVREFTEGGFAIFDLTDDELSKQHVRHMVGGRAKNAVNERLYRFEFPERPGALRDFLAALEGRWNISLFHYRNHGSARGQVLCGFQVPEHERADFDKALNKIPFPRTDDSDNPAYRFFLAS